MSKRLSLTLEHDDETAVEPFTHVDSPEYAALVAHIGAVGKSDAAVLRALIRVGADALRDRVMEEGYAAWAASMTNEERTEQQAVREHQRRARVKRAARD